MSQGGIEQRIDSIKDKVDWGKIAASLEPVPPKFSPHEPYFKQKMFLLLPAQEALYGGRAGGGKLLSTLYTQVPTTQGMKLLRDVHPGDVIFNETGTPTVVMAESEVVRSDAWKLTFDDGSEVIAHDDHLWVTYNAKELLALTTRTDEHRERRRNSRESKVGGKKSQLFTDTITRNNKLRAQELLDPPSGSVRSTKEIVESLYTPRGRKNHAIPVAGPLQLPEKDLLIDPYLLGVWLGDGTTRVPAITTMDPEIIESFALEGYEVSSRSDKKDNKASSYYFAGRLGQELRQLNLIGAKHVPHDYLWGSESQRLALLQGLLDTDGNVNKASVEFTNKNRMLTEAVVHLARSLGMKATLRTKEAKIGDKSYGDVYTTKFAANQIVFRLKRKAEQQSISSRRTTRFRYIKSAEKVGPIDLKCIRVSSESHQYLCTENLIPTHNSDALLMAALQHVDVPGYSAIIFRNSFSDLVLPGALMSRARDWLEPHIPEVRWSAKTSSWVFPAGSTITFGYLQNPDDHLRYKGAEFQFIGFDEVTEIRERHYTYLFSRLRKPADGPLSKVPLRCRAASNPAPNWVRERFIENPIDPETGQKRIFISAGLDDNPFVDKVSYKQALSKLDSVSRAQLENGDWWADEEGSKFQRSWFTERIIEVDDVPNEAYGNMVRYWDLASTIKSEKNPDPDWTVGALVSMVDGVMIIHDIKRDRRNPGGVEDLIYGTAMEDGPHVKIRMEQEGGASGKITIDHYARHILLGFDFDGHPALKKKEVRADAWAGNAQRGHVLVVRPQGHNWLGAFLDEISAYGAVKNAHDDQIDAISGAFEVLTGIGGKERKKLQIIV